MKKNPENAESRKIILFNNVMIYLMLASLLIAIVLAIISKNWITLFVCIIISFLIFIPKALEKTFKIDFPIEFEIWIVLFIYASFFLGEVNNYHNKFWWWDILLHGSSAIAFGLIGFVILYIMDKSTRIKAPATALAIFTFAFAISIGSLWEIFEFSVDNIFNSNMQKSGLVDTMSDLIVDAVGALIASVAGYFYLTTKKKHLFTRVVERFVILNPTFFKR